MTRAAAEANGPWPDPDQLTARANRRTFGTTAETADRATMTLHCDIGRFPWPDRMI